MAFLAMALALSAAAMAWLGWCSYASYRRTRAATLWALRGERLRGAIVHLDEVLTMSARMAAATGDLSWEERYHRFERQLDAALKEAKEIAPEAQGAAATAATDAANTRLVEMESRAFDLVRQGRAEEARAVLFSNEYEAQKSVYAEGMVGLAEGLSSTAGARLSREEQQASLNLGVMALSIPFLAAAWLVVLRAARLWQWTLIAERGEAAEQLQRLAMVAEQAGEGIALADLDGRLQFVNSAWARMHGYETGDELVGRHLSVFHTEEQMKRDVAPFNEQVMRKGQHSGEQGHVRRDGVPFTTDMTVTLFKAAGGKPLGLTAVAADITVRKQAEEERSRLLREMGERIKELTCMYGVVRAIREDNTLAETFHAVVSLIPPAWRYPETTRARVLFDGEEYVSEPFQETEWKQSSTITVGGEERGVLDVCYLEARPERDKGPFTKEERRLIDGIAHTLGEVAEAKRAKAEVLALKQQIEFILGATRTGLDIIDTGFNIRYIDPEWRKAYGDPAGRKCYEYFMGRSDVCPGCGIVKAMETKGITVTEQILVKEDNRPIQVTTIPFQNEEGEWLVAEVNVDITERKRAEEQLRETLADLQLFNRLTVGRELRMIELKREVNEMAEKAGRAPLYDMAFAGTSSSACSE